MKEKTAEQMFEELGYKCTKRTKNNLTFERTGFMTIHTINFFIPNQQYMVYEDAVYEDKRLPIQVLLHKAITKQMEELGWL